MLKYTREILSGENVFSGEKADELKLTTTGITERNIQKALYFKNRNSVVIPNYIPPRWGSECDLFVVRKTLWSAEYEIKISRADFKADFRKKIKHRRLQSQRLQDEGLPTQFFYVMPSLLVLPKDVPEYAGLIYCQWHKNYIGGYLHIKVIRNAPRIGKHKRTQNDLHKIEKTCYHRFWSERLSFDDYRRQIFREKQK